MKATRFTSLLAIGLLAVWRPAMTEDIELFVRADPASDAPNVLFVIDNAANFSSNSDFRCQIDGVFTKLDQTVGGIEQCALHKVISELPPDSVNIGVMVYNAANVVDWQGVECFKLEAARPGGCLVYPMQLMNADNKAVLLNWIKQWKTNEKDPGYYIKANSQATGGSMQEAWAYLAGRQGLSGRDYVNSLLDSACNTYVIFLGNSYSASGSPGDQTGDKGPRSPLEGGMVGGKVRMNAFPPGTAEQKVIINKTFSTSCGAATLGTPHENKGYYADEWSRYLNANGVITYTIGLLGDKCQADYAATLTSMAAVGGGKYFPTRDFDELVTALKTALSEMLSVNSVFASVSLPISVNTEGTYLNQVYIGLFRPDKDTFPRWVGNLKQYRLGKVDGALKLLDAKAVPEPAISSAGTGFLSACALSYWTPTISDTYWSYLVERNCETADARSNTPDGPVVEKGAQGYTLRGMAVAGRNLKTCGDAGCVSIADFGTGTAAVTKTLLGDAGMSDGERSVLINWGRGLNNRGTAIARAVYPDEEPDEDFVLATAMRPSVHGDVIHSRPVAISYAEKVEVEEGEDPPPDEPKVVVFYGGNDGVLRAINGNRTEAIGGVAAGRELWSFMAPEFMRHLKRMRDNAPNIKVKGLEGDGRQPKPYGFDGPFTAYAEGADRRLFATMRRGGRMVYAFDVSDIVDDPNSPSVLWRFGCPNPNNDDGCTVGATDIGQTWSAPRVFQSSGYKDGAAFKPMIMMGGGYDKCEDTDLHACDATAKGRRIYVLDATDGTVLKEFATDRPVAADVLVVTDAKSGIAKWAYAVDLGGNVYRISGSSANTPFAAADPDEWTITKVAALGCATTAPCAANRKFMYAPDVVLDSLPNGYVLLVGSGDREKPLHRDLSEDGDNAGYPSTYATKNYFFMLRDFPGDPAWLAAEAGAGGRCGVPMLCLNALLEIAGDGTPTEAELAGKKGWYLGLKAGEQVVTSAITVFGGTTFSTHEPTSPGDKEACSSDLGTARVYNVRYANAAPTKPGAVNRFEKIAGGGLPPSPVAGKVRLDDGTIVPFIIGADGSSPLEGGEPNQPALTTLPKSITYWYIEK